MDSVMSKRRTSPDTDRGFSLLEILVVVTILGVLAAVVVFSVRGGADDAEAAAVAADARTLETAEAAFAISAGRYADEDELVAAGHLRQPSDLHDIVIDGDTYRLVQVGGGTTPGGAERSDEVASGGDGGSAGSGDGGPVSETTLPETTLPETTLPETTLPETTLPETTLPETTLPETTLPESTLPETTLPETTVPPTTLPAPSGRVTCAFTITQAWGAGGNGELTIENATDKKVTAWAVTIETRGDKLSLWNADKVSSDRGSITAKNVRWNGTIVSGSSSTPTGGSVQGKKIEVGQSYPCEIVTPEPDLDDLDCDLDVTQTWPGGGNVRLTVENDGKVDVSSWTVEIEAEDVRFTSWSGVDVVTQDEDHLTLSSQDWTSFIGAGDEQRSVTAQASGKLGKKQSFDCEVVDAG